MRLTEAPSRILAHPLVHRAAQILGAPGAKGRLRKIGRRYQRRPPRRAKVLEVACGPVPAFELPEAFCVGLDVEGDHVRSFLRFARWGVVGDATALPFRSASFWEVRCCAFLHHLSDEDALRALREARRVVSPEGAMLVMDGVWPKRPWARPIAWLVDFLDRGRHFRTEEELLRLVERALRRRPRARRYTHAWNGLEVVVLDPISPEGDG